LPRHFLNFIRRIILSIPSCVLDPREQDGAKARKVVGDGESMKAISAVRRLECDAYARFGNDGVKVASNWMPHRVCPVGQHALGKEGSALI
jgi:hypothetical protein